MTSAKCSIALTRSCYLFDKERPDEKAHTRSHPTFSEFLLDRNRCLNKSYYGLPRHHHSRLVVQCIGVLPSLDVNILQLPGRKALKATIPDLAERLQKHVPRTRAVRVCAHLGSALGGGLLPYEGEQARPREKTTAQCVCWKIGKALVDFTGSSTPTKGRGVGGDDNSPVLPTFSKLRAWVEIMAYMGRLDTVTEALRVAQKHIKGRSGYEEGMSQLAETEKLGDKHYLKIEKCPYEVHEVSFSP